MSRYRLLTAVVLGTISVASAEEPGNNPSKQGDRDLAAFEPGEVPRPLSSGRGTFEASPLSRLAAEVLADDAATATAAVQRLRAAGPEGLAALLEARRNLLEGPAAAAERGADPQWLRLIAALDAVGAQRSCYTSRLYWYTDLTAAVAAARREGKPILSLRLLGKLTDEFSCANSRYFRTTLYANHEISDYLRTHFVLHWQSVRPVPRVTIDFGDGRKLERTITGNSVHWVLDPEGRPFDALPGLYGPQAFLRELMQIETGIQDAARLDDATRNTFFVLFHHQRLQAIQQAWQRDLAELNITVPARVSPRANTARQTAASDKQGAGAVAAGARAASKGAVEFPVLRGLGFATEPFRQATTEEVWLKLGARHQADAVLDDASVALIRSENPVAASTDPATGNSVSPDEALAAMIRTFQSAIAVDTVRNEYELRRQLHEWFAAGANRELEPLNERVYAELFLTPRSDPWLGLVPADSYTGLERGGRRE
jgi:hypothetical protein